MVYGLVGPVGWAALCWAAGRGAAAASLAWAGAAGLAATAAFAGAAFAAAALAGAAFAGVGTAVSRGEVWLATGSCLAGRVARAWTPRTSSRAERI